MKRIISSSWLVVENLPHPHRSLPHHPRPPLHRHQINHRHLKNLGTILLLPARFRLGRVGQVFQVWEGYLSKISYLLKTKFL
jgi:hypothetical protein